jgi:Ca-activated chloride channel family protein
VGEESFKLEELARAAGTSARTVRYYVQRGLLPAPAFRGKDTAYGPDHLVRLQVIRRLQDAYYPLDAIAVELVRLTAVELERIAEGGALALHRSHAPSSDVGERQTTPASPSLAQERVFREKVFHRIELAPGLELSIAEDAPPASRREAERIVRELKMHRGGSES